LRQCLPAVHCMYIHTKPAYCNTPMSDPNN
jgi:hypothetical protein